MSYEKYQDSQKSETRIDTCQVNNDGTSRQIKTRAADEGDDQDVEI